MATCGQDATGRTAPVSQPAASASPWPSVLGLAVSTVAKYMVRDRKRPSQTWRTFLENRADCLASVDFFTVVTERGIREVVAESSFAKQRDLWRGIAAAVS